VGIVSCWLWLGLVTLAFSINSFILLLQTLHSFTTKKSVSIRSFDSAIVAFKWPDSLVISSWIDYKLLFWSDDGDSCGVTTSATVSGGVVTLRDWADLFPSSINAKLFSISLSMYLLLGISFRTRSTFFKTSNGNEMP
jgi:hypothetical protein